MPLVSVIIPTFNRPDFLQAALHSVLRQTFTDFEVLVVDDASTTDIRPLLAALDDRRIRYFRHETNRGEAAARNRGILNARGAYLAFLDDDDEWLPEKLHLQLRLFSQVSDGVGCVYGGYEAIRGRTRKALYRRVPTKRGDLSRDLLRWNVLGAPLTVMLKRECLDSVGLFDEAIAFGVDYDLWIRLALKYRFDFTPAIVARYTVHHHQLSNDAFIRAKGHADLLRKYGSRLRPERRREARIYFALGLQMCLRGELREARRAFLKAVRINPLDVRACIYLALSLSGTMNVSRFRALAGKVRGINPADR